MEKYFGKILLFCFLFFIKCFPVAPNRNSFFFQLDGFHNILSKEVESKIKFILSPIRRNEKNPLCNYVLEIFDCKNQNMLEKISIYLKKNFLEHPVLSDISKDIKKLYCNANTKKGLASVSEKKYTYAYILKADEEYIGFVLARFNFLDKENPVLQIKRIHSFYEVTKNRFFGVGKSLLNLTSVIAKTSSINKLFATATYPVRGFFEHLGWNGKMIQTNYNINGNTIFLIKRITHKLPQFKCSFLLDDNFKGF